VNYPGRPNSFGNVFAMALINPDIMKKILLFTTLATCLIAASCGAHKARRAEAKKQQEAARLEKLEKDKKQFEQQNSKDLGK
jgi:hypothetical protein